MDAMGIACLATDVTKKAQEMKVSESSVAKMVKCSQPHYLPRLIVEAATVSTVGRPFCIATYGAEGDDPLVFSIHLGFHELEMFVRTPLNFNEESHVGQKCKEAAKLVLPVIARHKRAIQRAEADLTDKEEQLLLLQYEVEHFQEEREQEDLEQLSEHEEHSEDLNQSIKEKQKEIDSAKATLNKAKAAFERMKKVYDNVLTHDDFISHAKKVARPALAKYNSLFEQDKHLKRIRQALISCKVFDILHLKSGPSLTSLHRCIDNLKHFEFDEFDDDFLGELKKELPDLLRLVNEIEYDFEGEDAAQVRLHCQKQEHMMYLLILR